MVGRDDLEDVLAGRGHLALFIHQGAGHDHVEGVHGHFLIVLARAETRGHRNAQTQLGHFLGVQRDLVVQGLQHSAQNVAVGVADGHGRAGQGVHVRLLLVGQGVPLRQVRLRRRGLADHAAVRSRLPLEEGVQLLSRLPGKEGLEDVHLLLPGAAVHLVAVADLALGLPGRQQLGEAVGGLLHHAVHLAVAVRVVVVARAGPAGEGVVLRAVMVGRDDLEDVRLQVGDAALGVGDDVGHHHVEGVHRHLLVVLAWAKARGHDDAQAVAQTGGGDGLGGLLGGGGFLSAQGLLHSAEHAVAGPGRAGHGLHAVHGAGRQDGLLQRIQGRAADGGGLLLAGEGQADNLAVFHGHFSRDGAAVSVGFSGENAVLGQDGGRAQQHGCQQQVRQCLFHGWIPPVFLS